MVQDFCHWNPRHFRGRTINIKKGAWGLYFVWPYKAVQDFLHQQNYCFSYQKPRKCIKSFKNMEGMVVFLGKTKKIDQKKKKKAQKKKKIPKKIGPPLLTSSPETMTLCPIKNVTLCPIQI